MAKRKRQKTGRSDHAHERRFRPVVHRRGEKSTTDRLCARTRLHGLAAKWLCPLGADPKDIGRHV